MRKLVKIGLAIAVALFVFSGCATSTLHNVKHSAVELDGKQRASLDSVYKAIKKAGTRLGWSITRVNKNRARGVLNLRDHEAVVSIPFSTKDYSINYVSSQNLKYNASKNTIHRNYNKWIINLDRHIKMQFLKL